MDIQYAKILQKYYLLTGQTCPICFHSYNKILPYNYEESNNKYYICCINKDCELHFDNYLDAENYFNNLSQEEEKDLLERVDRGIEILNARTTLEKKNTKKKKTGQLLSYSKIE